MPRLAMLIFFFVFGVQNASAEYRITEDRGGQIGEYLRLFQEMRAAGTVVVIDGMCLSACTGDPAGGRGRRDGAGKARLPGGGVFGGEKQARTEPGGHESALANLS